MLEHVFLLGSPNRGRYGPWSDEKPAVIDRHNGLRAAKTAGSEIVAVIGPSSRNSGKPVARLHVLRRIEKIPAIGISIILDSCE